MTVRVRFAPSPTGYLHIGGARTALFNWLWARQQQGVLVLRVEDTDRERSTEESVQAILDSLTWLGLDWDEGPQKGGAHGPYFQMLRLPMYREMSEKLIGASAAYRCYCTKEELAAAREKHAQGGGKQAFRYPGTCRNRKDHPDKPFVVRLRAPASGSTGWNDRVKGRIDVPNEAQQDVVLMRADGVPLYNFGAAIDDITMGITLVSRGDDHVVNTPIQIMIYEALGYTAPEFAHLPMILAPNGEKLSKRHASVSALEYRDQGFLPDAVLNYLARLGWSHGDQEIFSRKELIKLFNWDHVGSTGAKYDLKKFMYVQASHLRQLSNHELVRLAEPFFKAKGITPNLSAEKTAQAMETVKSRASTFVELVDMAEFYFREEVVMDAQAKTKFLKPEVVEKLQGLHDVIREVTPFAHVALEQAVQQWLQSSGFALKEVAQPARVALTGKTQSPGLFEVMEVLGKEKTLERLNNGCELARVST